MKRTLKRLFSCGLLLACAMSVRSGFAQETPPRDELPEPLPGVVTNVLGLEESGHFHVDRVEYRAVGREGDQALVWTIVTKRMLTYQHAQRKLEQFRVVQFYVTHDRGQRRLSSKLIYYPNRVRLGAANNQMLLKDEEIEIWFYLDESDIRRLEAAKVDTMIFLPQVRPR